MFICVIYVRDIGYLCIFFVCAFTDFFLVIISVVFVFLQKCNCKSCTEMCVHKMTLLLPSRVDYFCPTQLVQSMHHAEGLSNFACFSIVISKKPKMCSAVRKILGEKASQVIFLLNAK